MCEPLWFWKLFQRNDKQKRLRSKKKEYNIFFESTISKKDGSTQSQQIICENIFDELYPRVRSSNSSFKVKNIDSFSKRTQKTKFCSNFIEKFPKKKVKLISLQILILILMM